MSIKEAIIRFVAENPGCEVSEIAANVEGITSTSIAAAHLTHLVNAGELKRTEGSTTRPFKYHVGVQTAAKVLPRAVPPFKRTKVVEDLADVIVGIATAPVPASAAPVEIEPPESAAPLTPQPLIVPTFTEVAAGYPLHEAPAGPQTKPSAELVLLMLLQAGKIRRRDIELAEELLSS